MKDNFKTFEGIFKIALVSEDGTVIDSYEDRNMIMQNGRVFVSKLISGQMTSVSLSRLVLGVDGYYQTPTVPLQAGQSNLGVTYADNMTKTISETTNDPRVVIDFTPPAGNGSGVINNVYNSVSNSNEVISGSFVNTVNTTGSLSTSGTVSGTSVKYFFDIPSANCNGLGSDALNFNEAGLYFTGGTQYYLFNYKTFPIKAKDNTTRLQITWEIMF